jgi:hypothetical protein
MAMALRFQAVHAMRANRQAAFQRDRRQMIRPC